MQSAKEAHSSHQIKPLETALNRYGRSNRLAMHRGKTNHAEDFYSNQENKPKRLENQ